MLLGILLSLFDQEDSAWFLVADSAGRLVILPSDFQGNRWIKCCYRCILAIPLEKITGAVTHTKCIQSLKHI
ncbi:unnamed protein product [Caretta caretta]